MANKETRRQFLGDMGKLALGAFAVPILERIPQLPPTELNTVSKDWELFQPGDQVFAIAKEPCVLYAQPDLQAPTMANIVMDVYEDTKIFQSPRHIIMDETTLRVRKKDAKWAQILMQDGYSPFIYPDSSGRKCLEPYIRLEDFNPLFQMEPTDVLRDTKPLDKEVIIIHYPSPQLFLVEQDQIIAHIPVILGSPKTPSPIGDFHVSVARISTHMMSSSGSFGGFVGVGFCLEIVESSGVYMHNAPWWIWPNLEKGRYGSHGCINLPDASWLNASIRGKDISMAQFIFQWALTNLPPYDQKKDQYIKVRPKDPGADQLLPVHVMNAIEALRWVRRANPDRNWDKILAQAKALGETEWIIPRI